MRSLNASTSGGFITAKLGELIIRDIVRYNLQLFVKLIVGLINMFI
jgi:hypothetical protein